MTPTIYRIEFPDGRFYIGATVNFAERRRTHLRHARKTKSVNPTLQKAFDAHPICGIYQVASGLSRDTLHLLETEIIRQEKPPLNRNIAPTRLPPKYSGASKPWGPYKCLRDAATALGVSYAAVKKVAYRYSHEAYVERLATPSKPKLQGPPDPRRRSDLIKLSTGWHRRADVCKVSGDIARKRRSLGWEHDASYTTPAGCRNPDRVQVSAAKVVERYGVDPGLYYSRRFKGWTTYEALGLTPRPEPRRAKVKKRMITAGGQRLPLDVWAKKLGVAPSVIHGRLHNGWSEAEAVGVEKRQLEVEREARKAAQAARKVTRETYTHKGFTGTLGQICREFGYNYPRASTRRNLGWVFEDWFAPCIAT